MFASDRDLLVYEPRLFLETGWLGQLVFRVTGAVGSSVAFVSGFDFAAAGVGVGSVVSYGGASYEVAQVIGLGQLGLSRLRASSGDSVIGVPTLATGELECFTYAPQMAVVHGQILRMLGIDPDDPSEGALTADAVVNPGALTRLECLGTLHLVYSAAAAASAAGSVGLGYVERSLMYRERFAAERGRVTAMIDLDGDGEAESVRRPGVSHLVRG
ncbi:MAG: hypothetical protein AAFS11_00560 [Planctomycetota bacterium]